MAGNTVKFARYCRHSADDGHWRLHDTWRSDDNSPSTESISFAMSHSSRYVYSNTSSFVLLLSPTYKHTTNL